MPLSIAASIMRFISLAVTPAFFSLSVLGYTPVMVQPSVNDTAFVDGAVGFSPAVAEVGCMAVVVGCEDVEGAGSTSGWTRLTLPLNAEGFPKNMNSDPGVSFSCIHFIPLKNTSSIWPLPSSIHTLILFIVLNFKSLPSLFCSWEAMPAAEAEEFEKSSVLSTRARIWI